MQLTETLWGWLCTWYNIDLFFLLIIWEYLILWCLTFWLLRWHLPAYPHIMSLLSQGQGFVSVLQANGEPCVICQLACLFSLHWLGCYLINCHLIGMLTKVCLVCNSDLLYGASCEGASHLHFNIGRNVHWKDWTQLLKWLMFDFG